MNNIIRRLSIAFGIFISTLSICADSGGVKMEVNKNIANKKMLVAYFSATGNTKKLSQTIASSLNAEIYEIIPELPYTNSDLNYNDKNSRSSKENADNLVRPAIKNKIDKFEDYDIVFLGYPIWWGEAPRIVNTFLESYDFSGKTIISFVTTGGSGIGSSTTKLQSLAIDANWKEGKRFSPSTSKEEIIKWINTLEL